MFAKTAPSALYDTELRGSDLKLSFMSLAELRRWSISSKWGQRRQDLLESFIADFEIIYPDDEMCTLWATVTAHGRATGRNIAPQDAWIAATALRIDAPLATNNRCDFEHVPGLS